MRSIPRAWRNWATRAAQAFGSALRSTVSPTAQPPCPPASRSFRTRCRILPVAVRGISSSGKNVNARGRL